ncbi:FMN-binding pyridoxamine 5'-phosphate oxidase-like protein [Gloeomargarita lithophora Alchichica-D10]|uniref:FMN-binding pyridoxamine 5'-phosphate oxidase-like protein n=1 Tax=Gloeomargarita lithophora Alchichica-D10 TaxID=1188229 RepID=A0A1J0AFU9_9CYAN|nr:FMN-binding pyridoxamine 5'-phosphate oxidase-like protein [Gloeomargarita lithophora Alchichica-D10]
MAIPGWQRPESPFHAGEQAIHARLGTQDMVEQQGRRFIRESMPAQHQQFFAQLPYLLVGTVDWEGNPWASILVGQPGFLVPLDAQHLRVNSQPLFGDPLHNNLTVGADIGLLGIELQTRRRNRLNGTIINQDADGFTVQVRQSFGNCPKYIQARTWQLESWDVTIPKPLRNFSQFEALEQAFISQSDTFFIATAYQDPSAPATTGVDVSHRGGKPGFIRVDDDRILTVPDFSGNCMFNTFGNLELNPRAGLIFIDFGAGDILYLTGNAWVVWEGEVISQYPGAERLFHFELTQGIHMAQSLPLRGSEPEFSPFLAGLGAWVS